MNVTKALLRRKRACSDQINKFADLFPEGVVVTEVLCIEHADVFEWDWAALHLLSLAGRDEYKRVEVPAWTEYFDRVYNRATTAALDLDPDRVYDRATAAARDEFDRVRAAAFGRLAEKE